MDAEVDDDADDAEIGALVAAIYGRYHYDFRHYAWSSLRRRLRVAKGETVLSQHHALLVPDAALYATERQDFLLLCRTQEEAPLLHYRFLNRRIDLPLHPAWSNWLWERALRSGEVRVLDVERVTINDLFSAGPRVAFHVTLHGPYTGGLDGVDASVVGAPVDLNVAGVADVAGGTVRDVRAVSGKLGIALRHRARA